MTNPLMGHPDYQDFPTSQGPNLFASTTTSLLTGNNDTAFVPTFNFSSIWIDIQITVGSGQLLVQHSIDGTAGGVFATDTLLLRNGLVVQVRMPIRAPYVRLRINNTSGSNGTATTFAQLQSGFAPTLVFPITSVVQSVVNKSLAASGTDQYDWAVMKSGPAQLMLAPRDTTSNFNIDVMAMTEANVLSFYICRFQPAANSLNQSIYLPARPISVIVTNTLGASHSYDFCLAGCPSA